MASYKKTITLGLDYSEFEGGIKACNEEMKNLDAEFKLASAQMENTGSKSDKLALKQDYLAQKIKDTAKEHHIEIVENKPLARMLYANVEVGSVVPPELYQAVAEVLAFVYHLQGKV